MNIFLFFASAAFLFSIILPNHYVPWVSFYHEFAAFSAGLLLIGALLVQMKPWQGGLKVQPLELPLAYMALVLLACIPVLQYTAGLVYFFSDALLSVIYILFFMAMLFAGYSLTQSERLQPTLLQGLAVTLILASIASTWLALYQWLLQPGSIWVADLRPGGRPYANLAQPNHLATLLAMSLASVLFLYEKRFLHPVSAGLLAVLFVFTLALTQSRTPWLIAIFFIVLWQWKSQVDSRRLGMTAVFSWVTLYAGLVVALPYLSDALELASLASLAERAHSYSRWPLYTQFVHAIIDGPLWGYGWQQAGTAQLAVTPFYDTLAYSDYTHNIFLDLLIWNGPILGILIIVLIAAYLLHLAFRAHTTEQLFAVLAVGCFLMHSLLEYPHAYAYFLLPVGLLIGSLQASIPCKALATPRWLVLLLLTAAISLHAAIWFDYRAIEEDFRLLRFEKGGIGTLRAEQPAPDVLLLTQQQALTWHARIPAESGLSEGVLSRHAQVTTRFSQSPSIHKYILVLALNDKPEQAYAQLQVLKKLHGDASYKQAVLELYNMTEFHPEVSSLLALLQDENP